MIQTQLTDNCDCEEDYAQAGRGRRRKPWVVTIHYDDYPDESPLDYEGSLVKIVENDHRDKTSEYLWCQYETDDYICEQLPSDHPVPYADMEWHQHIPHPDLVASLWASAPNNFYVDEVLLPGDSATDDQTPLAVLLWENGPEDFLEWLTWADDGRAHSAIIAKEKLTEYLKAVIDEYSKWRNGEVFWYSIHEGVDPTNCAECGRTEYTYKEHDACGGFIGYEWAKEAALECLPENADYELKEPY